VAENSFEKRTWSDSQLASAVAASHSWRGVMRELGLCATSAGAIRFVKRHVTRLGLDTSHFTGQRRWSDAQLKRAAAAAVCWGELIAALGLAPGHADSRHCGLGPCGAPGPRHEPTAGTRGSRGQSSRRPTTRTRWTSASYWTATSPCISSQSGNCRTRGNPAEKLFSVHRGQCRLPHEMLGPYRLSKACLRHGHRPCAGRSLLEIGSR